MTLLHGSLFSGIGGFDLASEWAGWTNVFHCEINPFGKRVLEYYWPNAISYDDITKTDFTIHRGTIDVLTGGFPCQPFSIAGKRKGTADHRNLWPEYYRAIKEIQPIWVVGENVPGLINWSNGVVFEQVQADLESEGYEVWPVVLPACSVNAPHRRDRVWFVANSNNNGQYGSENGQSHNKGNDDNQTGTNTIKQPTGCCGQANDANTIGKGLQGTQWRGTHGERDRAQTFRPVAEQIEIPTWDRWPTQPPVCSGNDGLPSKLDGITFPKWRNESIKGFGNAIVPQVAYRIFRAINLYNNELQNNNQSLTNKTFSNYDKARTVQYSADLALAPEAKAGAEDINQGMEGGPDIRG